MYKVIYFMSAKSFRFTLSGGTWNPKVANMFIGSGGDRNPWLAEIVKQIKHARNNVMLLLMACHTCIHVRTICMQSPN